MPVSFVDSAVGAYEVDVATGPRPDWLLPLPNAGGPLVAGDLLLFAFSVKTTDSTPLVFNTIPTGAVALIQPSIIVDPAATTRTIGHALYYKFVTSADVASPPPNFGFTWNATYDGTFSTSRFRGVDQSNPFAVTAANNYALTNYTASANVSKVSPSVTTNTTNTMLVAGVIHRSGSATLTTGDPVNYTRAVNGFAIGGRGHAVAYAPLAAAAASSTATWRQSSGGIGTAWQTSLRPAAVSGVTPTLIQRMVSEVTTNTALISVKVSNASSARLKVGTDSALTQGVLLGSPVAPDAQGMAFLPVSSLTPGKTDYYYRIAMSDSNGVETLDTGPIGKFRTDGTGSVTFTLGSCNDVADPDVFTTIAENNDDMLIYMGDLYYDDASGTSLTNFQSHMDAKISAPKQAGVYSTRETIYTPSDHDGMNNNSTAGSDATAWTNWNAAYRQKFLPSSKLPTNGVYRTFTKGAGLVRFIVLDTRSFKSNPTATDDANKTALGSMQKQWLKDTISAAQEKLIVLINADPWIGAAVAGDDAWLGYTTERTELALFFASSNKNIIMTGGDMHALAADSGVNSPGGIPVFHAAPFSNESSIKGGPYSSGTYPTTEGVLVQQYGRIVISESAGNLSVVFKGYSSPTTERMSLTKTYTLSGIIEWVWNGTSLIRTKSQIWNGTSLVSTSIKY